MQAIVTKYLAPTNSRGARIKATCHAGSITVPYNYSENPHLDACNALRAKLGWGEDTHGRMVQGGMPDGTGSCFVFAGVDPANAMGASTTEKKTPR